MYAGALGDNTIECYVFFFTTLGISADIDERKLALARAREHRLDTACVAVVTAERTIERKAEGKDKLGVALEDDVRYWTRG
jgi:nuclear pore complex protein Nup107